MLSRAGFTMDDVADAWSDITNFDKSTHPADVAASFAPIFAALSK
jgi:hypothetical protein